MKTLKILPSLCVAAVLVAGAPAYAQVERSGGGGENQRFMQQYQQLAAEKTSLQAQVTQLKKDLDAAKGDLEATKKERDALKSRSRGEAATAATVSQLAAARDASEKNVEAYKQRMTEIVGRYRDLTVNLREVETDRTAIRKSLDERNLAFDKCADSNVELYGITMEVLDRWEHVGLLTKVGAAEPFTQITRTRIQNAADEYRARAAEYRTHKRPSPAQ